jgi:hypothetical protein
MNDREIMESAIRHMGDRPTDPDETKGFFRQLWDNLRLKFSFSKKGTSVEITDHAKF